MVPLLSIASSMQAQRESEMKCTHATVKFSNKRLQWIVKGYHAEKRIRYSRHDSVEEAFLIAHKLASRVYIITRKFVDHGSFAAHG